MTKRLREAIRRVEELPEARQNEIADLLFELAGHDAVSTVLNERQWDEISRRMSEPRDYASDAEVEEFFKRHAR